MPMEVEMPARIDNLRSADDRKKGFTRGATTSMAASAAIWLPSMMKTSETRLAVSPPRKSPAPKEMEEKMARIAAPMMPSDTRRFSRLARARHTGDYPYGQYIDT